MLTYPDAGDHDCRFDAWDVALARLHAALAVQPGAVAPMVRACTVCGLRVDLVAVAAERLVDQRLHP